MDRKSEIKDKLEVAFRRKSIVSRKELNAFFLNENSNISPIALRNRIYQLVRLGVINAISGDLYTLEVKPAWKPAPSDLMEDLSNYLLSETFNFEYSIWTTKWFNEFSNLQAFNEVVFLEVELLFVGVIYHKIASEFSNVYLLPDEKEQDYYISTKEKSIVIKSLITKAPIHSKRTISNTRKLTRKQKIIAAPIPRLEKILTDLFYDKLLLKAWRFEEVQIWQNAHDHYNLNFSTIYNYAKRRDNSVRIIDFILNNLSNLPDDIVRFLQKRSHSSFH